MAVAIINGILTGAPLWVWPLLVVLVLVGLKASRTRTVIAWPLYLLAFLGVMSVNAVNGLSPAPSTWAVFALAYLMGAGAGFRFQRGVVLAKTDGTVTLRGEWVTLSVLMLVFWLNFVTGTIQAIAPDLYDTDLFAKLFAGVSGLAAGTFLGRAVCTFAFKAD